MSAGFTDPGSAAAPLIGGWSLDAYTLEQGGETRPGPFGAGLLSYTGEGTMSAQLVAPAPGLPRYAGYFGGFSVDPDAAMVAHHVHAASDEALTGQVLEREFEINSDRLTLAATIGDTIHRLVWRRAGTEQA